jgi:hypothetical protein
MKPLLFARSVWQRAGCAARARCSAGNRERADNIIDVEIEQQSAQVLLDSPAAVAKQFPDTRLGIVAL